MFKKLFAGCICVSKSAPTNKPAQVQLVNPAQTILLLENQSKSIEKRIKDMENKVKDAKAQALAKKKAGDQRGAVMALKQMKMFEGELTKHDGQQIMLEQQKITIETTLVDADVIKALQQGSRVIKGLNELCNVDDIADIHEELEENMQEVKER